MTGWPTCIIYRQHFVWCFPGDFRFSTIQVVNVFFRFFGWWMMVIWFWFDVPSPAGKWPRLRQTCEEKGFQARLARQGLLGAMDGFEHAFRRFGNEPKMFHEMNAFDVLGSKPSSWQQFDQIPTALADVPWQYFHQLHLLICSLREGENHFEVIRPFSLPSWSQKIIMK